MNEVIYGRYLIKSRASGSKWQARAFRGKPVGVLMTAESEQSVIAATKAALDAAEAEQRAARGADGYPTTAEVRAALAAITISTGQRAMLAAHRSADEHIMTATELAKAAGYTKPDSYKVANSQYGKLARKLAEELEWQPALEGETQTWTYTLATGADGDTRADIKAVGEPHWRWKMRPEVVQALAI